MKPSPSFLVRTLCCWCVFAAAPFLRAQLAITEVMSSASNLAGTNAVTQGPDFWELTNFGPTPIDLTGYRFSDIAGLSDAFEAEDEAMFGGVSIAPNESIVFVRNQTSVWEDAAHIRAWWGSNNLPAGLQIYFYTGRGFSGDGNDAVQLWKVTPASTTVVDRVELYQARQGNTFTYDPVTGFFDSLSASNVGRAFKAVAADDVGSPGFTTGPASLVVIQQPQSLTVDAGTPAIFSVRAGGLPRARYQWRINGNDISGETSNVLALSATRTGDAGSYTVELKNGVMTVVSESAVLEVNTIPSQPRVVVPPADLVVTPNQTAVFQVTTRGYPLPTFQWKFKGEDIPGATAATLLVPNAGYPDSGLYAVQIQNPLGTTNTAAVLEVRPKPNLKITEMMGGTSSNTTIFGRGDWWELTNFDTNVVNLRGYRFDDFPRVLEGAVVITNDVILQPGETMLFIQEMTPEFFTLWWGEENLPENVQFYSYTGNGINADTPFGDSMTLWNNTTLDRDDFIASSSYLLVNDDFTPVRGISLTFACGDCDEFGLASVVGEWGAINASRSDDIGSPGYVTNHPPRTVAPRFLDISRNEHGVHLTWKTQAGKRYELLGKDVLDSPNWTPLGQQTAAGTNLTITDTTITEAPRRFYRLRLVPEQE